tara:strand:+ start:43 stop:669 length:627 start_codon:yes stop_codon:yes gene_type:complete
MSTIPNICERCDGGERRINLDEEYGKVVSELVKVRAELVEAKRAACSLLSDSEQKVITLKKDAEKRRIYNDAVFQDWIEGKIRMYENKDESDTITIDLPEVQGDLTAQQDYPDYIHFLKGMEDEGEGSDDVFSDDAGDDWFVKSVESEVQFSFVNGRNRPQTIFKVVVEKVITYQCTICEDYQVRGSMMTNGFDCHICEDCHAGFEMM